MMNQQHKYTHTHINNDQFKNFLMMKNDEKF
jgi:hypothetical protein